MITTGTWNLENLFRTGSDAGAESEAAYAAKLTALAETITELAPDVLAVQEVGEPESLGDLVNRRCTAERTDRSGHARSRWVSTCGSGSSLVPVDGEVVRPCNRCSLTMITYKQRLEGCFFCAVRGLGRWGRAMVDGI